MDNMNKSKFPGQAPEGFGRKTNPMPGDTSGSGLRPMFGNSSNLPQGMPTSPNPSFGATTQVSPRPNNMGNTLRPLVGNNNLSGSPHNSRRIPAPEPHLNSGGNREPVPLAAYAPMANNYRPPIPPPPQANRNINPPNYVEPSISILDNFANGEEFSASHSGPKPTPGVTSGSPSIKPSSPPPPPPRDWEREGRAKGSGGMNASAWVMAAGIIFLAISIFLLVYNKNTIVGENLPVGQKVEDNPLPPALVEEFSEKDPVSKNPVDRSTPYNLEVYGTRFYFENEENMRLFVSDPTKYVKPKIKVKVNDVQEGEGSTQIDIVGTDGRSLVEGYPQNQAETPKPAPSATPQEDTSSNSAPVEEPQTGQTNVEQPQSSGVIENTPNYGADDSGQSQDNVAPVETYPQGEVSVNAPPPEVERAPEPPNGSAPRFTDVPPPEVNNAIEGEVVDEEVVPPGH
ncbi:hypothetical protein IJT10_04265 [bacterium]|nr:hypothetical protein [bacterium]